MILNEIKSKYPNVPTIFPEGAHTIESSHLHIIVNWLEIEAASTLLGRDAAADIASKNFVYSGIYRIVLADWEHLSLLYRDQGLAPIRMATDMTEQDFALAARMEEASVERS